MDNQEFSFGSDMHIGESGNRIKLSCDHHNATMYIVSSESNWVCKKDSIHNHSIAGFLNDLTNLDDKNIEHLMQKWGIYYRHESVTP
ncbi:MAG: hypothetical protein ACJ0BE_04140 [Dehalococcoidia bacterium]|jgi:hypothetical protein